MAYQFGKSPPREIQSFGISGLLEENAQVYYDTLFSTRHLGKVSDLISACLRETGADELRLRVLLLLNLFQAAKGIEPTSDGKAFSEPLVLECGVDSEKIAIGISFTVGQSVSVHIDDLDKRILTGQAQGEFELLLSEVQKFCDQMVLRVHPESGRFEVATLIARPGKIENAGSPREDRVILVNLEGVSVADAPKISAYIELGDVDHPQLLKEDVAKVAPSARPLKADLIAKIVGDVHQPEEKVTVSGTQEDKALEEAIRLRGEMKAPEGSTVVSGGSNDTGSDITRLHGSKEGDLQDHSMLRVQGSAAHEDVTALTAQVTLYRSQIEELQKKLAESAASRQPVGESAPIPHSPAESAGSGIGGLLNKIWPFKNKKVEVTEEVPAPPAEVAELGTAELVPVPPPTIPPVSQEGSALESVASKLVSEIEEGEFAKTIKKAQSEVESLKKQLKEAKAKRFIDGLMGELLAEKSRLNELAKKLNLSLRQKELDFRNREQALHQEIRRRDDTLKLRTADLVRTKDQLAEAQREVEKLKTLAHSSSADLQLKHKVNHIQKLLTASKDENAQLMKKMEDLRGMLNQAQHALRAKDAKANESGELHTKLEYLQKQTDELKKTNQQLTEKLTQMKKSRVDGTKSEELKKKLEQSMKMVTIAKKETEKMQLRVEELQREETRLKNELARAQAELRSQKGGKPPGAAA